MGHHIAIIHHLVTGFQVPPERVTLHSISDIEVRMAKAFEKILVL